MPNGIDGLPEALGVSPTMAARLRNGRSRFTKTHFDTFTRTQRKDPEKLYAKMGSIPIQPSTPRRRKLRKKVCAGKKSTLSENEEKRVRFLIGLQRASKIHDGSMFNIALERTASGKEGASLQSTFKKTGKMPRTWLLLVEDKAKREELATRYGEIICIV